jgi:TolB-like protein
MTLSINFYTRAFVTLFAVLICFSGRAATNNSPILIAVLPVFNLSGKPAPLKDIRQSLINSFKRQGLNILDEKNLERFIVRHRVRYIGGINEALAWAFREETGVQAVLITSVELYSDISPPKLALTARLVSTGNDPEILWMAGLGSAGDDSPGFLELSLIENSETLVEKAMQHLSTSLTGYLSGEKGWVDNQRTKQKFRPKVLFRSPVLGPGMKYTVAVIPFFNFSGSKYAGEVMALHFVRQLGALKNIAVIEPGEVRQALLEMRITMNDGISLADADDVFKRLDADLILTGKVLDYQDYQGPTGKPRVNFSASLIERRSREVVWSCKSYNEGDEGVWFFDLGKIYTAHSLSTEMVQRAVETIFR